MRRHLRPLALLAGLAAGLAAPGAAHDFWIEVPGKAVEPGALLGVRLKVGEHFLGDPVPRDPALLRRFSVFDPGGAERPIPGAPGRDPAGLLRASATAGTMVVVYESAPSLAELDREKLTRYLAEEGLESLPGVSAAAGLPAGRATTRDLFSRHVKALLPVAGAAEAPGPAAAGPERVTTPVGLAFELVPDRDPTRFRGGGTVGFRVLRGGAPVVGIRVAALPRRAPLAVVAARSRADGRVALDIGPGEWLVKAVLAEPVTDGSAELRSYWAAVTFHVPPAEGAAK